MDTTGDIPNDFITQFHNLTGDTIGERKRNFFKLIKNPGLFSTQQQIDDAINLKPRTYLESLFKVDLLIHLKKTAELTEILKEGNEVFISKILKQHWYFQEAFNDLDAQSFTNNFLPCMSYAMRMKLLKRISSCWSEEKVDALFDALCERYGLHIAVSILQNCSKAKIQEVLNENEPNLRPNQVKNLFDKDPSLFKLYVEQLENRKYKENKVLYHVAIKCPTLLLELEKDKKVEISNIGRRTSERIAALVKEDIPKDINRYTRLLKKSVVVRRLGNEFEAVYLSLFPKRIDSIDMYNSCHNLLRLYSKNRRWDLFAKTFSQVFPNNSIDESFSKFKEEFFLHLNPSREIIQKWADVKYKENENRGDIYLKYFEPAKAIPLIKEKINVISEIDKRSTAVMLLIQTCSQNKDLNALEDVLKYICTRHRNEDSHFRLSLYGAVSASFKLETLNETHWKYINEQIKISTIRKDLWFWCVRTFTWKHLEFLLKNCKDPNAAIIDYINIIVEFNRNRFDLKLDNPPIEKQIYIAICKQLPEVVKVDSEHYESVCRNLVTDILDFSISQPKHFINLADFPYLITFINKILNKTEGFSDDNSFIDKVLSYNITCHKNPVPIENSTLLQLITLSTEETKSFFSSAKTMITKKARTDLENEVLKLYFEKLIDIRPSAETVLWFMRNEPRTLVPYFEKVMEISLKNEGLFEGQQLRLYSHFDYDRKASEFYKAKLGEEVCDESGFIVKSLMLLLPTTDLQKVVDYLQPKKAKLDLEDAEMQKMYKLQCELAEILHKVQEPSKILSFVMKFCVGDYLQSALPSLYGVFSKTAEKLLYPYVDELSLRGAVSVKKHALYLSCEVLDKKTVLNLLKTSKQSDVSSQKHQFSAILKYFLKNPSQDLLARILENMLAIDKNDTETLKRLKDVTVPRKYRPLYIEKCWGFFEDLERSEVKVKDYLESLLQSIDVDVLKSLSPKFVIVVITRYLPVQGKECLKGIEEFANKVLEHRETERTDNFEIVFKILSKMKKARVRCFFSVFIKNPKDINRAYANSFEEYWKKHFPIMETFEEHIALKLLKIHLDCTGDPKLYAGRIVECLGQLVSEYGVHAFRIFKDELSKFMIHQDDKEKYLILHNILLHKLTPNTCILVLRVMDSVDDSSECFEVFQTILRLLGTVQDTIVQVYYKAYLLSNEIEET